MLPSYLALTLGPKLITVISLYRSSGSFHVHKASSEVVKFQCHKCV